MSRHVSIQILLRHAVESLTSGADDDHCVARPLANDEATTGGGSKSLFPLWHIKMGEARQMACPDPSKALARSSLQRAGESLLANVAPRMDLACLNQL